MEPLDDKELNQLLQRWQAPGAPSDLRERIPLPRAPKWQWLLTGSIRIPVPVGLLAVVVVAVWMFAVKAPAVPPEPEPPSVNSLVDFQPVRQLEPKVIGTSDGGRE